MGDKTSKKKGTTASTATATPTMASKMNTVIDALAACSEGPARTELEGILMKLVRDYIGPIS